MATNATGSDEARVKFTVHEIFNIVKHRLNDKVPKLIPYLEEQLSEKIGRSLHVPKNTKASLSSLFGKMRTSWQEANRKEGTFVKQNDAWLQAFVSFPAPIDSSNDEVKCDLPATNKRTGRPSEDFDSLSHRSKRRRTKSIRETWTLHELTYATHMSLRSAGQLDASKIVHDIMTSPSRASKYRQALELSAKCEKTLSAEAALSLYIEYKFTKRQYQGLRTTSNENNCKLYPSYKKLAEVRKHCYPPNTDITITDNMAEVWLQALLDHTTDRILLCQEDIIRSSLDKAKVNHMLFFFKWGCHRSSGHSDCKQTTEDDRVSDDIFFISVVPLQLITVDPQSEGAAVIWKNPSPLSPRFCRPLKIHFMHESTKPTESDVQYIEEQINSLVPFENIAHEREISVSYNMTRNQDIKRRREDFPRKCQRLKTMEEVFKQLLVTSDPYISSIRKLPQNEMENLTKEAIELLLCPENPITPRLTMEYDAHSDSENFESDTDSN